MIGHRHGLGGIAGNLDRVGDNERHRIPDMFDGINRESGRLCHQILGLVIIGQWRKAGHWTKMGEVSPRQHQANAFDCQNGRKISDGKAGMCMGTAQDQSMQMTLRIELGHRMTAA